VKAATFSSSSRQDGNTGPAPPAPGQRAEERSTEHSRLLEMGALSSSKAASQGSNHQTAPSRGERANASEGSSVSATGASSEEATPLRRGVPAAMNHSSAAASRVGGNGRAAQASAGRSSLDDFWGDGDGSAAQQQRAAAGDALVRWQRA
jgi:hypothetical protein